MQGWSTVSIRIENPVLAKIVKKYKTLGFKTKAASLSFLDDDGEECVQYESVPGKIEDIPGCIAEGFRAECDDEGASAFEKECAAHKQEILDAYKTVYWNYSTEYPLEEPVEDHVDRSYFDKFRADFAAQRHITVEEIDEEEFKPYVPDINIETKTPDLDMPKVPEVDTSISNIPEVPKVDSPIEMIKEIPKVDVSVENTPEIPSIPNIPDVPKNFDTDKNNDDTLEIKEEVKPLKVEQFEPIAISEDKYDKKNSETKKPYDVEEILKIAKSPIVTMDSDKKEEFANVSPIKNEDSSDISESEFDEEEIVKEMISRLNNRLSIIKERQKKYDSEKQKLEEDEKFVNDLIETSNEKREQLDKFENELNEKEEELKRKKKELDKKINDVLPFADAIMKTEN